MYNFEYKNMCQGDSPVSSQHSEITRRRVLMGAAGAAALPAAAKMSAFPAAAKAPLMGPARAGHRRFKLGDFEVTVLHDGAITTKGPYPVFGNDQFEEDVDELVRENFLPNTQFQLSYAPVLVNTGKELVLFDAGNGPVRRPERGQFPEALTAAGYTPDQVDIVVITHCHPDHIGGLMRPGGRVFPKARYVIGAKEYDHWSPAVLAEGNDPIARRARLVQTHVVPLAEQMKFLKPGDAVVSGIEAVASYGHTPGHLAFHVESAGQRLMIWGDAIVHYAISFQRPDWQLVADMDNETAIATRERLLDMAAADRLLVTAYHLPFPALGFVEKLDEGYRFVPASYQLDL